MKNIKGVTSIKLIDADTGEVKDSFEENTVVDGITPIIQQLVNDYNYGGVDGLSSAHIYNPHDYWTKGLMLLEDIQSLTNKTPRGKITGIAGQGASKTLDHALFGDLIEEEILENSIRRKWQFGTNNANGTINCISLSRMDNWIDSGLLFAQLSTFNEILNTNNILFFNKDKSKGIVKVWNSGTFYKITTNESFKRVADIYWDEDTDNSLDLSGVSLVHTGGFADDGYFYCIGYINPDLWIFKIDSETMTEVGRYKLPTAYGGTAAQYYTAYVDGDYLYYNAPYSDPNATLVRVKLSTLVDPVVDYDTLVVDITGMSWALRPMKLSEDVLLYSYVSLSTSVPSPASYFLLVDRHNFTLIQKIDISPGGNTHNVNLDIGGTDAEGMMLTSEGEYDANDFKYAISSLLMLTINNLGAPITKTDSDILQIEYTLTWS